MNLVAFLAAGALRVGRLRWRCFLILTVIALTLLGGVLAAEDDEDDAIASFLHASSGERYDSGRPESRRVALAMANSSGLTILQPNLVTSALQVLQLAPGLNLDTRNDGDSNLWCGAIIKNIVFRSSLPTDGVFYFLLDDACEVNGTVRLQVMAVRKGDLDPLRQGLQSFAEEELVSYWWRNTTLGGIRRVLPVVYQSGSVMTKMSSIKGMDLSPSGTHLMLSTDVLGEDTYSRVTFLSVPDGNRTSSSQPAAMSGTLTLNPAKTQVYLSDIGEPTRVLAAPVAAVENAVAGQSSTWTTVASFPSGSQPNISTVFFNHQSFAPDGACLYFVDRAYHRIWSMQATSGEVTLVAGTGVAGVINGDGGIATFRGLRDILVTPDGCNLFVSEIGGRIRWITLQSPCGRASSVETIATYPDDGLWGLAFKDEGMHLKLYAGGNDGSLFEVALVKSALHVCGGSAGPGGGSPTQAPIPIPDQPVASSTLPTEPAVVSNSPVDRTQSMPPPAPQVPESEALR
ncbi:hypothetical protein CBR_g22089 [Chara braunii]|uniref:SMP-30/Gluconolactonase/LRE-like region domain-containing protein n=1 Tax=Chara braunii TaxID=69332 RepID=A0A388L284_CHABU|nr:hypothetical protein CBR_g22089 [Chara braunii]|eukprot:GBG76342.1 hypothetical protein CBR_g22089 [Chara braunii]